MLGVAPWQWIANRGQYENNKAQIEETSRVPTRRLIYYFIVMQVDCKHLFVTVLPDDPEIVY
jgi:hypothetical protein